MSLGKEITERFVRTAGRSWRSYFLKMVNLSIAYQFILCSHVTWLYSALQLWHGPTGYQHHFNLPSYVPHYRSIILAILYSQGQCTSLCPVSVSYLECFVRRSPDKWVPVKNMLPLWYHVLFNKRSMVSQGYHCLISWYHLSPVNF